MTYNLPSKLIHWTMALVILGLLMVGFVMEDLEKPLKFEVYGLHKSFGVLALMLILIRIPVRIKNPVPALEGTSRSDEIKAKAVHGLLYLGMLLMPISGILMSQSAGYPVAFFGLELPMLVAENEALNEIAHAMHGLGGIILSLLVLAHIGAALYHHFKLKDETLKRMSLKG